MILIHPFSRLHDYRIPISCGYISISFQITRLQNTDFLWIYSNLFPVYTITEYRFLVDIFQSLSRLHNYRIPISCEYIPISFQFTRLQNIDFLWIHFNLFPDYTITEYRFLVNIFQSLSSLHDYRISISCEYISISFQITQLQNTDFL